MWYLHIILLPIPLYSFLYATTKRIYFRCDAGKCREQAKFNLVRYGAGNEKFIKNKEYSSTSLEFQSEGGDVIHEL